MSAYNLTTGRAASGEHVERKPFTNESYNAISLYPFATGAIDAQNHFNALDEHLNTCSAELIETWGIGNQGKKYKMQDGTFVTISRTGGVYGDHKIGITQQSTEY